MPSQQALNKNLKTILKKIKSVAQKFDCDITIRTPNPSISDGVIEQYVTGKPLLCKAKSSNALFINGKLALHPCLAKDFPFKDLSKSNHQKFFRQSYETAQSLSQKFQRNTFKAINCFIILSQNETPVDFKVIIINNQQYLLSQKSIIKSSTACSKKLVLHYLLRLISPSEQQEIAQTNKLPQLNLQKQLYQIYLRFEEQQYNEFFDEGTPSIIGNQKFYAVKTFGELCGWDSSQSGLYFPIVADYDIYSITPHQQALHKDSLCRQYKPITSREWLSPYDASFLKLNDPANLHHHLGIISPFENKIRIYINEALKLPMVRHGCEINSLTPTLSLKATDFMTITSKNE